MLQTSIHLWSPRCAFVIYLFTIQFVLSTFVPIRVNPMTASYIHLHGLENVYILVNPMLEIQLIYSSVHIVYRRLWSVMLFRGSGLREPCGHGGPPNQCPHRKNKCAELTCAGNSLQTHLTSRNGIVPNRRANISLRKHMHNRTCANLWTRSATWLPHRFQIASPAAAIINMERITNDLVVNYKRFTKVSVISLRKSW